MKALPVFAALSGVSVQVLLPCGILLCKTGLQEQPLTHLKGTDQRGLTWKELNLLDCYLKKYFPQLQLSQVELDTASGGKTGGDGVVVEFTDT